MTQDSELATCPEMVMGGSTWDPRRQCGKAVKRDGLCGIHAAAKDKREAGAKKRAAKRDESSRLTAALRGAGLNAYAHPGDGIHGGTIRVEVDAHELLAYIERLEAKIDGAGVSR